ncbi:MAG: DUF262 domain-containing protein, partial [Hyphomicrobiaceae bacterium]|nr:DUF262 domain-containing protein [Hyphomicrobiaceae bacterium]
MKPDKLTVHEMFERERRYVVPLYQRSYVWTREEQWEPLWEDIQRQAEAALEDPYNQNGKTHFLGAVVLNVNKIVGRSMPRSEIIDGQQRLTTLQILLAALRDYANARSPDGDGPFDRLTKNPVRDETSDERFKVWPTNADRQTFSKVMTAGSPSAIGDQFDRDDTQNTPLKRMAEAYLFFHDAISTYVEAGGSKEEQEDRLHSIAQALRTALQFVVIELEDSDDPQVIFETLNARGQPLLPSDLIRNFIFLQASNQPTLDTDRLYNTYWRDFDDLKLASPDATGEDRFWHVQERQGRLTRPRIDLFIFHYLVMKTEADLAIGRLFREFKDWRDEQSSSIEEFLSELKTYSALFRKLVAPEGNSRLAKLAARLKSLDTSTVYPTLLFLTGLPQSKLSSTDLDRCLTDLESWLVRRFVCQWTNKNYNRFFLGLLVKLKRADEAGEPIADALRAELLRSNEPTAKWPTDQEFKAGWLAKPIYVKSRIDRCAMVLRALEEQLRTTKNEAVSIPTNLTVEHLLPQKGSLEDYPYAETIALLNDETAETARM